MLTKELVAQATCTLQQPSVRVIMNWVCEMQGQPMEPTTTASEPEQICQESVKMDTCPACHRLFCPICKVCETSGCAFNNKRVDTPYELQKTRYLFARSQKVKGFAALVEANFRCDLLIPVPSPWGVVIDESDIPAVSGVFSPTALMFARPCPIRPRHGFVESREVNGSEPRTLALSKIWAEARSEDPEAEMLVTRKINASYNLVITPSRLAVGTGHAGATSGQGSYEIPLMGVMPPELTSDLLSKAEIDISRDDPYVEAVISDGGGAFLTQLRAGAKIPAAVGRDYIPAPLTVTEVVDAQGDLLEWEEKVGKLPAGAVVYHGGGTLVSHYSVHCLINKIPVVTSHRPRVGERLLQTAVLAQPSVEAVRRGLGVGAWMDLRYFSECSARHCTYAMLTILHNAPVMTGEYGVWLGMAAAVMLRVGMAASHGEARHARKPETCREDVYLASLGSFLASRTQLGLVQWLFLNHKWRSSFGGPAWAKCTNSLLVLDAAARALLNMPSPEAVTVLTTALNQAVNQAHNGGWWLDKFVPLNAFEQASEQSLMALCHAAHGVHCMGVLAEGESKNKQWEPVVEKWASLGDLKIVPPGWYAEVYPPPKDDSEDSDGVHWELNYSDDSSEDDEDGIDDVDPTSEILFVDPASVEPVKAAKKPEATSLTPSHYTNLGEEGIPMIDSPVISSVQGRYRVDGFGTPYMHIQYRIEGMTGYYAVDVPLDHPPAQQEAPCNKDGVPYHSYSGSNVVGYFPMDVFKDAGSWCVCEPINSVWICMGLDLGEYERSHRHQH